ncbi:mitochondrial S-adenosylmethionine carrier protein isoform X1 [Hydra vulgaris]|uniref:S-adenosylmethionine mitochondrial carrier protein n=1 Tax=Hydra vulgaris TaxID=6087 RepID=T2MAZ3_HYDVU|nr:S-adenosylmethionine mitochondrial carrier protein [Hydra vulgaris]
MGESISVKNLLIAGSFAGLSGDIIMFPLDTIKTRLQSSAGFWKTGGFFGIYRGLGSTVLGSAPSSATFFLAYELSKKHIPLSSDLSKHMFAACLGETASCFVRIPFEVVKQHAQVHHSKISSVGAFKIILQTYGLKGFSRGYLSMLIREIPFSLTQMPIWEFLKKQVSLYNGSDVTGFESGLCGSVAGAVSAAITTPLDVAKTRIILAQNTCLKTSSNPFRVVVQIFKNEGIKGIFAGIVPRVVWISVGGFIFLGAYDEMKILLNNQNHPT